MSSGEVNCSKCLEAQEDELEVLGSIYGDEWKTESESDRSYSIEIKHQTTESLSVVFYVTLPKTYPFESPPQYIISAPGMKGEHKSELKNLLEEVYMQNIGQTVLFQWIDKIREYLSTMVSSSDKGNKPDVRKGEKDLNSESCLQVPEIFHGDIMVDRKSAFQGHAARIVSIDQVGDVLTELKKSKKIANATHNMYAYRVKNVDESFFQDHFDDGETHAGSRILQLMKALNVSDAIVVVTRWYGGINLGANRFRLINCAARQALVKAKLIKVQK